MKIIQSLQSRFININWQLLSFYAADSFIKGRGVEKHLPVKCLVHDFEIILQYTTGKAIFIRFKLLKCPSRNFELLPTWMSQEVSKWLGTVGYNPNIPHL